MRDGEIMIRTVLCLVTASLFAIQPVMAEEATDSNFADYTVLLGGSPFGGSLTFAVNQSKKTTYNFTLGGAPSGLVELTDQEIGDNKYDIAGSSSWVGAFINHRPIDGVEWFRVSAGIGIGNIENEITAEDGSVYSANYTENPVGYLGIGFGADTDKGFQWAVDLGWLQTAGPMVMGPDAAVVEDIQDHWMFGKALPNIQFSVGYGF
jgi:hypothetical protein